MARSTRRRAACSVAGLTALALTVAACGGGEGNATAEEGGDASGGDVTLEFAQWWEPELPDGVLRGLMDQFEDENPGITVELLSGPYAQTREQIVAGAASGTMADVVGLDGVWVNEFVNQGAIADLSQLMADADYDDSEVAAQIKVDGSTYMIPVVNFAYMLFTNQDLLEQAGVEKVPETRSEFLAAAEAISQLDETTYGWALPLSLEAPNGVLNDVMSWVWASGGQMLDDSGQPDLTNPDVAEAVEYIKTLWDAGVVAPGAATMKEQDKVEEFTNGRAGTMISSLAHINLLREGNPDLNFDISAIPTEDGYEGEQGVLYASWGIGVAESSDNKEEAWKLIDFLLTQEANAELSTAANAFPGNTSAVPDYVEGDALFEKAFEVWNAGYPANEFVGLPVAEQLMRDFSTELQRTLEEGQPVEVTLENAQEKWMGQF